ncbi:prenyltransferase/squalene oxidase repeat-containing protein [Nannocystis pusilla]|uniref:prenyltransferase/squalene oxidase repeat-containing protein n=1 Tax=Nannocystis pusilla TaxID=889268 RepID=UPI003B8226E5
MRRARGRPRDPPHATTDEITTFTEVHRLVLRVVQAPHLHAVSNGERERLVDLLGTGRNRVLWEASATTHLLGLHAVRKFRPTHRVIADGLLRLTLAQNPDGGLPFLDSQDLWLAAVAGLAFLHHARLRPLTRRMAAFVAAWQARDGGWPFASGMMQTDVDTTTRCMEFLRAADAHRYRVQLDRGAAYLARMVGPTGGFPTWVRGEVPDLDMTAGAILALAPDGRRHRDLLVAATDFVLAAQAPDGTFERSWTLSEASAILRVVDALDAVRSSSSPWWSSGSPPRSSARWPGSPPPRTTTEAGAASPMRTATSSRPPRPSRSSSATATRATPPARSPICSRARTPTAGSPRSPTRSGRARCRSTSRSWPTSTH